MVGVLTLLILMMPLVQSDTPFEKEMRVFNPPDTSLALTDPPASPLSRRHGSNMLGLMGAMYEEIAILTAKTVGGTAASITAYIVLPKIYRAIQILLDAKLDEWAKSPPKNQVVIEAGRLRWEFGCSVEPVPWEFLEVYFRSKDAAVQRGFAPVYAKEWWFVKGDRDGDGGRWCYAAMRVAREGVEVVPPQKREMRNEIRR